MLKTIIKGENMMKKEKNSLDKLIIIWTSGDKKVALSMVFMYALNAKKREWWKEVCLIVWGPSAKLLADDLELQEYLARMKEAGVEIEACKTCAEIYGVTNQLEEFGIDVKLMGIPLTEYLKNGYKVMTF